MRGAAFSILTEAMKGCQERREVRLRIDGTWITIEQLTNEPGDEGSAGAMLDSGEAFTFDPDKLVGVWVGAKRR